MDFSQVYSEAVTRAAEARHAREALEQSPEQFVQVVNAVRTALFEDIVSGAPQKILESASKGHVTADIFTFNGNDTIDDISVLFVIKGQRNNAPPPPPEAPGPLLPELQAAMAPFTIVHDWDGISSGNRLVARWVN
jgi:hypothetical protein